jgi:hypothetical protein
LDSFPPQATKLNAERMRVAVRRFRLDMVGVSRIARVGRWF